MASLAIASMGKQLGAVGPVTKSNEQPNYGYAPLTDQERSFRLLELYPSDFIDDPIRCRLHDAAVGDGQKFEALSYRWGDSSASKTIKLDGRNFIIQQNLWLFLRQLRRTGHSLIWVDAICIDQNNLQERARQVQFMGRIYASAFQTLIWLGEQTEKSGAAFEFLDLLQQSLQSEDSATTSDLTQRYVELFGGPEDDHIWSALQRLCGQQSYWSRLWIIQEVLLAENLQLFCGDHSLSWQAFKNACAGPATMRGFPGVTSTNSETVHKAKMSISKSQFAGLSHQRALEQKRYLWQLLQAYNGAECKDLRDRIYGLLGLSRDHVGDKGLRVDYTRSELSLIIETLATSYITNTDVIQFGRLIIHSLRLNNTPDRFWTILGEAVSAESNIADYLKRAQRFSINGLKTLFKGSGLEEAFSHQQEITTLENARQKRLKLGLDYRGRITRVSARQMQDDYGSVFETEGHISAITYCMPEEQDMVFSIKSTPIGLLFRPNNARNLRYIGWTIANSSQKDLKFFWGTSVGIQLSSGFLKYVSDVNVRNTPGAVVFDAEFTIWDILCLLPCSSHSMRDSIVTWSRVPVHSIEHWNELLLNALDSGTDEPPTPVVADLSSLGGGDLWPIESQESQRSKFGQLQRNNRSRS